LATCDYVLIYVLLYSGKSGAVGKRLAASLSSVGVAATFVHAAEWGHGDLGEHKHNIIICVQLPYTLATICTKLFCMKNIFVYLELKLCDTFVTHTLRLLNCNYIYVTLFGVTMN